jgi:PAS domain S-box-containing protein
MAMKDFSIIDCVGDPIFVKDRDYRFVFVNDAACRMFGMPYKRWLGKTDYLEPGLYEYRFVVDGVWQNDPQCTGRRENDFGTENCVLIV